jgi:DNA repair protein RadC
LFQVSEIQLRYRPQFKASERPKIGSSADVYQILLNNWDLDTLELWESFKILLLNRGNRILGIYEVSSGGMAGTVADPKLIFGAALKSAASSVTLSHNHPSGQSKPSTADRAQPKRSPVPSNSWNLAVLDLVIPKSSTKKICASDILFLFL